MDNNQQTDDISSLQKQVKELSERVEKLEDSELHHENKGMNNKLSNHAYKTVQDTRGPLKPDEFIKHFTVDVFGKKEVLAVIRKFPNNTGEVKNQLSHIHGDIENQMAFRRKENESDGKLIKRIRRFNKAVEEKQENETRSDDKPKRQSTMHQFFDKERENVNAKNKKTSSKSEIVEKKKKVSGKVSKRRMRVKEADKENRKRKNRNDEEDDESCSSQEIEVEQITAKLKKRLKFNSSQESIESNAVEEPCMFSQRREPRPIISSRTNSEGSSQSDVISEDDSPELFTTTDVKSSGKRSKQFRLRSDENAPEYNGNEETVNEKRFPSRGKQIR